MEKVTPLHAIEKATKVLKPELRQKAFIIATQIGKATQEIRTIKILESLASKLSIKKEVVQKTIDSTLKKGLIYGDLLLISIWVYLSGDGQFQKFF